jgi:alanyl-tRNA synthetase
MSKTNSTTNSAAEVRQSFLDFFGERDHKLIPSSPVIPFEDPTLLFVNAGMNQFKKVFTGEEAAPHPRATSAQKCIRAGGKHNDLENVGFTTRHHTFFEMLGNFSFGDYFKEEAIVYAWEWLTKVMGVDASRLYATVYNDDDEAFSLWEKIAPELKNGRVLRFGKADNFWSMGDVGPCGPCSEIHYDRGARFGAESDTNCVNGEGERFVEIWNLVFMQYNQLPGGKMVDLPKGSVDTGAGLERNACVLQDCDSNYDIDLFANIIAAIESVTGSKYDKGDTGASHRVVADHLRALCFSIADGGGISNEKQGYVLRRILRRAARHGRLLGSTDPFIYKLVPALVGEMGSVYPELREKEEHVTKVIRAEEESFGRTLDTGLTLFEKEVSGVTKSGAKIVPGNVVFNLYDTHGFPVDLTEVMAQERGLELDHVGFGREMEKQRTRARAASTMTAVDGSSPAANKALETLSGKPATEFLRDLLEAESSVLAIECDNDTVLVVMDRTPFYLEAGGQISDIGVLSNDKVEIDVNALYGTQGYTFHVGTLTRGSIDDLKPGFPLKAQVNATRRQEIIRNHTATHLMHKALRDTLGDHVRQAGSLVSEEKLRFDFTHFEQMTDEQVSTVEYTVNEQILKATPVVTDVLAIEEAKKSGAMMLFGEKYGDTVRVVTVGDYSKEFCGGTHVNNTAEIGPFMITSEGGVSSGVRRIEALTGKAATEKMLLQKKLAHNSSRLFKVGEDKLDEAIEKLYEENTELSREIKKLKAQQFSGGSQSVGESESIGALTYHHHDFGAVEREAITGWADSFKTKDTPDVALALGVINEKPSVIISSSQSAVQAGLHVGKAAQQFFQQFGSRGGGKENFAQGAAPIGVTSTELFAAFKKIIEDIVS